ncbi:MAG TPA: hypothetical protein DDZ80_30435 [Cyanobacteria bacterium UBA8803]|nr:hypothetical protein [Cyanobacteria bacterium UBA9273]HBL62550.1 hypothetical protein [Cyanobacteria bacterium UBA8803]
MNQNYPEQLQAEIFQAIENYDPRISQVFYQTVTRYFPGTLPLKTYMRKTYDCLSSYGFNDDNTMGMVAICRDEITDPLFDEVIKYWGKTFNCCSLSGFVTMGKTGLAAATAHTPICDGVRRFTFYAMPHIAISRNGEIGKVYREGIPDASHACGALEAIVKELESGHLNLQTDMQDIEQTIIRQKILSTLRYGQQPDLVEITKLACRIIADDVEKLLSTLDSSIFKYAVMTGIQIHGPMDSQWVYPQDFYVIGSALPMGKKMMIEVFHEYGVRE